MNFDYKFFFGDFNFRIDCNYLDVKAIIERYQTLIAEGGKEKEAKEAFQWLLDQDQLLISRKTNEVLESYTEAPITFLPTYKYDNNSDQYDTSKKQRTPSW